MSRDSERTSRFRAKVRACALPEPDPERWHEFQYGIYSCQLDEGPLPLVSTAEKERAESANSLSGQVFLILYATRKMSSSAQWVTAATEIGEPYRGMRRSDALTRIERKASLEQVDGAFPDSALI